MGFLDRLLGRDDRGGRGWDPGRSRLPRSEDEAAVERYRFLLATAPPEAVEQVHREAFERLSPEQRRMVFDEFTRSAPQGEGPLGDDPASLARAGTRAEFRQPGFLEATLGGLGGGGYGGYGRRASGPFGGGGYGAFGGGGFGSSFGGSLLGGVAGVVLGSAIADAMMPGIGDFGDGGFGAVGYDGDFGYGDGFGDAGFDQGGFDQGGFDQGGFDQGGFDGGGGGFDGGGGSF